MRYEYKIEQFNEKGFVKGEVKWQELEDRLNALGEKGWNIQDIRPLALGGSQSGVVVFMKRETA
jgi:hypothetical protein